MGDEINKYVHVSKKVCLCVQPNVNKKCAHLWHEQLPAKCLLTVKLEVRCCD